MKKVASLFLAVVFIMSLGISAFAAEDIPPTYGTTPVAGADHPDGAHVSPRGAASSRGTTLNPHHGAGQSRNRNNDHNNILDRNSNRNSQGAAGTRSNDMIDLYDTEVARDIGISPSIEWLTSDTVIRIAPGEMFLVQNNRLVVPEERLEPGTEYEFMIFFNASAANVDYNVGENVTQPPYDTTLRPLREVDIFNSDHPNGRLRFRATRGANVLASTDLRLRGPGADRSYHAIVTTRDAYGTSMTDVTFAFQISGRTMPAPVLEDSTIGLQVGWARFLDSEIDSYTEGDIVTITNERPVMTRRQVERLVRNFNHRAIELEFEGGLWRYTGRMSGMGDINFFTTEDVIPAIINRHDQDFKFLSFPAGITFPTNGELRIDVSDVSHVWDRIYTYLYRDGRLTRINTSYDSVEDMIYFRTNFLGMFVMTDVEITDAGLIQEPTPEPETPGTQEPSPPSTHNPPTGLPAATNGVNTIAGLGFLSLITAGTVIIRKRK